jgi:hypothetical protein
MRRDPLVNEMVIFEDFYRFVVFMDEENEGIWKEILEKPWKWVDEFREFLENE